MIKKLLLRKKSNWKTQVANVYCPDREERLEMIFEILVPEKTISLQNPQKKEVENEPNKKRTLRKSLKHKTGS